MDKKGQAAMEFLMTYGWAILAAIIAIAVLAYFGVFSPSRYVPNACIVANPWGCNNDDTQALATGNKIVLALINSGGDSYNIMNISIGNCNSTAAPNQVVLAGGSASFNITQCSPTIVAGQSFRGDITITYNKLGSTTPQTVTGSILRKVA